jgi:hypothetical protein
VAGAFCVANGSESGICSKFPAEGQTCYPAGSGPWLPCDSRLDYCDSVSLKCVPTIEVGGNCSAGAICVGYATCDSTGHCVASAQAGESCDDATGPHCLGALLCQSGKCAIPPVPATCP